MIDKKEDIDFILLNYFLGHLNSQEEQNVENWVNASEENRRYFLTFQKAHLFMCWGSKVNLIKGKYADIHVRIRRQLWIRRAIAIAASIIILFGVGYWTREINHEQKPQTAYISPGETKALLYTNSQEVIPLAQTTTKIKKDGAFIQINSQQGISYDSIAEQNIENVHRIVVPRGGEYKMILSDGTRVWLNSNSEISYPVSFPSNERKVLLKGEAYFEVTPNSKSPFVVQLENVAVKVYGTKFNINTQTKGVVETVLAEGRVGIITDRKEVILQPNELAVYNSEQQNVSVKKVDISSYIAWKDGNFLFEKETLERIMDKLSLWYDVSVFYVNHEAKNIRLTGDMPRYKKIQDILYFFEQISDIKFEVKEKTIIINYKKRGSQ